MSPYPVQGNLAVETIIPEIRDHLLDVVNEADRKLELANDQLERVTFLRWATEADQLGINYPITLDAIETVDLRCPHGDKESLNILIAEANAMLSSQHAYTRRQGLELMRAANARSRGYNGLEITGSTIAELVRRKSEKPSSDIMREIDAEKAFTENNVKQAVIDKNTAQIALYELVEHELPIDAPDASIEHKRKAGISPDRKAIYLHHVTDEEGAMRIQQEGFIGIAYRGVWALASDVQMNIQMRKAKKANTNAYVISICVPVDIVRRDPRLFGLWCDLPDPTLATQPSFAERTIYSNQFSGEAILNAGDDPNLYPTRVPTQAIVEVKSLSPTYKPPRNTSPEEVAEIHRGFNYGLDIQKLIGFMDQCPKPEDLLDTLQESPFLRGLYTAPTGNWESITLRQHTYMVMRQFKKYFEGKYPSNLVSEDEFLAMLALHDIGKPLSTRETYTTENQHAYTKPIVRDILTLAGLDASKVNLLVAIACQNHIGNYIQSGSWDTKGLVQVVREMSIGLGVPPKDLFDLMYIYYMSDASAYTTDAGSLYSLDNSFNFDRKNNTVKLQNRGTFRALRRLRSKL